MLMYTYVHVIVEFGSYILAFIIMSSFMTVHHCDISSR